MALVLHFDGDINVQTMHRQAGIFIADRNSSVGWSAHSKTNSIFGGMAGHSNILFRNVNILNDPDTIDTPIDDRDVHFSLEDKGDENLLSVGLDSVNVATMSSSSNVFLGDSHITGVDSNQKQNTCLGDIYGNRNHTIRNVNYSYDSDLFDGNIQDQDIKIANVQKKE